MRVAKRYLTESVLAEVERRTGPLRRVGRGRPDEQVVFTRRAWGHLTEVIGKGANVPVVEASSSATIQAYNRIASLSGSATTPAARTSLLAAAVSLYVADPALGTRAIFLLR
jgi:hypothetical protein